ncbi:MAG TPA: hypothetical protein VE913_06580 [Longimicrobium sp.]|nr:hypothetical protein [Longimicrobium sp.]
MRTPTASHSAGFAALTRGAPGVITRIGAAAALFVVGVVIVLILSRSRFSVIAFVVVVMGALAGYGLWQLAEACKQLAALGPVLGSEAARLEAEGLSPDAAGNGAPSGTPAEGVRALLDELAAGAPLSGDVLRTSVDRWLAPAAEALAKASFLRVVTVLAGLFGTVFFFSQELGSDAASQGTLDPLLTGLRGALACTLTGILGSVVIGFASHGPRHLLGEFRGAAERFFLGPVQRAVATRPSPARIANDLDVWVYLAEEVKELRKDAQAATARMGDDAHSYSLALQEVGRTLAALPHLRIPPELALLEASVAEFREGTRELWKTVEVLVPVVRTLGVEVPAQLFERLESVAGLSERATRANQDAARLLEGRAAESEALGRDLRNEAGDLRAVAGEIRELSREPRDELHRRLDDLDATVRAGNEATRLEHGAALEQLAEQLRTLTAERQLSALTELVERAGSTLDRSEEARRGIDEAGLRTGEAAAAIETCVAELRVHIAELDRPSPTITPVADETAGSWRERVRRAPLMRFARMLRWWPGQPPTRPSPVPADE